MKIDFISLKRKRILLLCSFIIVSVIGSFAQVNIAYFKYNYKGALSLTFDDGLEEHYSIVFPELEKRSLNGTFAIVGKNVGGSNKYGPCVTWKQLREISDAGHELSNHGWAHRTLTKISFDEMKEEIKKNDSAIYYNTGFHPITYVYPGNRTNDTIIEYVSKNRVYTRTSQFSLGKKRSPEWFANKVRDLIDNREWGVSMTHGITYGYDAFNSMEEFIQILDIAAANKDQLWIAPLSEIGAYVMERENTTLDIKKSGNKLYITPHMTLPKNLYNRPLTLNIDKDEIHKIISAIQLPNDSSMSDFEETYKPVNVETLKVFESEKYFMVNFMPDAGTIICEYQ